jgi:hypothetical protein
LNEVAGSVYDFNDPSGSGPFDFSPHPKRNMASMNTVSPLTEKYLEISMWEGSPEQSNVLCKKLRSNKDRKLR